MKTENTAEQSKSQVSSAMLAKVDKRAKAQKRLSLTKKGMVQHSYPLGPARPLNAYNFFFRDERVKWLAERVGKVRNEKSRALFSSMGKEIARRWKSLSSNERIKYNCMAKLDSERYYREKKDRVAQVTQRAVDQARSNLQQEKMQSCAGNNPNATCEMQLVESEEFLANVSAIDSVSLAFSPLRESQKSHIGPKCAKGVKKAGELVSPPSNVHHQNEMMNKAFLAKTSYTTAQLYPSHENISSIAGFNYKTPDAVMHAQLVRQELLYAQTFVLQNSIALAELRQRQLAANVLSRPRFYQQVADLHQNNVPDLSLGEISSPAISNLALRSPHSSLKQQRPFSFVVGLRSSEMMVKQLIDTTPLLDQQHFSFVSRQQSQAPHMINPHNVAAQCDSLTCALETANARHHMLMRNRQSKEKSDNLTQLF